jgi:flagellar motor switch protein FliN/FliY
MADDAANVETRDHGHVPPETGGEGGGVVEGTALDQAEIEALLNQTGAAADPTSANSAVDPGGGSGGPKTSTQPATPSGTPAGTETTEDLDQPSVSQEDIELLLSQAEQALSSVDGPASDTPTGITPFEFKNFAGSPPSPEVATVQLISDVQLDLNIELGRTHMYLEDILKLRKGAVVPLDKLAGDPVDIFANGRLIARGEVLVLNDNFCVRVAELVVGEPEGK